MEHQNVAIVLGGTNPHKALIENLKSRGYYTILIDYYENPPAKSVADKHIRESTLDKEKVYELAKEYEAKLVISTCIDQANVTACYVAGKLNLTKPYSYEIASEIADKTRMKQRMVNAGIPTASFILTDRLEGLDIENLNFPLVVKPSDTNGSKGVMRVDNQTELKKYLANALGLSRNGKAVIEEFVEGDEFGIDCFITNGIATVITTHRKRKPNKKDGSVIFSIGSISPAPISDKVKLKIGEIANKIAKEFGLENTPLLMQLIINGEEVNVVEFAPRIGGGLNFRKIKMFAHFDILSASVDSFLNIPVKVDFKNIDFKYSENHIYTQPGIFGKIVGIEDLIKNGTIKEFYINKSKGSVIEKGHASKDRIGSFIAEGKDLEEIKLKIRKVFNYIKIYDESGSEMKFESLYDDLILD